jgi:hypothetical protein
MKIRLFLFAGAAVAAIGSLAAGTLELQLKETAPPTITQSEPWQLTISSPGWLTSINGTIGIRGLNADIDITLDEILQHLDMIIPIRVEAQKGPFGIYSEFWYVGLSTGANVNGLVQSVDVLVNETYFDGGLSWRLINQPRGSLAIAAGTHFFNLYEKMTLHGRTNAITAASEQFVDNIADDLEARLNNDISNSEFTAALRSEIQTSIKSRIDDSLGGEQTKPTIPHGPLAGRIRHDIGQIVDHFVQVKVAALQARIDALHLEGEARRAAVHRIVNAATRQIADHLAYTLETKFDQTISKDDYWFDPYLGLYGRYNFSKTYYTAVRGQIGGFGVGADLMWQVEGVLGVNLTRNIFSELGYRALGVQYENNGLAFDAITHGPEITTGITF